MKDFRVAQRFNKAVNIEINDDMKAVKSTISMEAMSV